MKTSWFQRIKEGLQKSQERLTQGITEIFTHKKLDEETIVSLEELLIEADLGLSLATRITEKLKETRFGKEVSEEEVKTFLAHEIEGVLKKEERPLSFKDLPKPVVILMAGVNGSGKTTSAAKLAAYWREEGYSSLLVAGDTFRAAAIEQLSVWGKKLHIPVFAKELGADPAALAYEAIEYAQKEHIDLVIFDSAGRLHNNKNLMDELEKIVRVMRKKIPEAPHVSFLVLDGTVGQNAHNQVTFFQKAIPLTHLIVTKVDGSARGGAVVGLIDAFKLPLYAIGVGEKAEDLRPFEASAFAAHLVGLPEKAPHP